MHEPGQFWTLAHCDAGPHNVLLPPDSAMLIDFEFGQYACCLMDMVSARMGFPHAYWGQRVPPHPLRLMEQAYRHELAKQIPQAAEEDHFELALVQACAHWALGRLSHFWKGFLREYLEIGEALTEGRDPERVKRMKQWQMTYIRAVIEATEEFDYLPATQQLMRQLESALLRIWPDLALLPYYAVFER
jgi:Ser/Thr protein kinase RdoA (MazF antagonist)